MADSMGNSMGANAPEPSVDVSVIIVTRNRHDVIDQALARLFVSIANTEAATEVIVVDASTVASDSLRADTRLRYVYRGDIPYSMVTSRNIGIEEARGRILAFIDDDCFVSTHWLERIVAGFEDPTVGLVGGRVINHPWAQVEKSNRVGILELDLDVLEGGFSRCPDGVIDVSHLPGGNLAVRTDLAHSVGGFDPGFVGSANGEETDFVLRVRQLGHRALFDPAASVEHRAAPRSDGIQRSLTNYVYRYSMVRNRIYFLRKHGARRGVRRSVLRQAKDGLFGVAKGLLETGVFLVATLTAIVAGLFARVPRTRESDGRKDPFGVKRL